jgi:beta-galactosidase beta subunit
MISAANIRRLERKNALAALPEMRMLAYSEGKEAALWKLIPDVTPLHMSGGHFAILWPKDAHAPCSSGRSRSRCSRWW